MAQDATAPGSDTWFLAMVALLPLHTVALHVWISWKPWLVALVVLCALQGIHGWRHRRWPWSRPLTLAAAVFLTAAAASWSGAAPERYARLLLALAVGSAILLTTASALRRPGMLDRTLRVIVWSGAAMALSAVMFALVAAGTFGAGALDWFNGLPLVDRVAKSAYLSSGFVAVTNWHQDPGYAAAWMNLWATITLFASLRGAGTGRRTLDAMIVGGLWLGVFMTFSRTGVFGALVAVIVLIWLRRDRLKEAILLVASASIAALLLLGMVFALDRPDVGGDIGDAVQYRIQQGLSLGPGPGDPGGGGDGGVDYRGVVWPAYVDAFRDHPIRGIGLGTGWEEEGLQEPHNLLLELLGEMGLIGLIGFGTLFVTVMRTGRGEIGTAALIVAFSAAVTQTVLFEATWWFAAGLLQAPTGSDG